MRNLIKIALFILMTIVLPNVMNGQFSMSYYGLQYHKVGLGINFSKRIWTEIKVYNANYISLNNNYISFDKEIAAEMSLNYNFIVRDKYNCYLGANGYLTYDEGNYGIGIIAGTEIFPFNSFKRLSFHLQIFPHIDYYEDIELTNEVGVRFRFYDYKN